MEQPAPAQQNQSTALTTTAGGAPTPGGEVSSGLSFEQAFALDVHERGAEVDIDLEDRRSRHRNQHEYSESRASSSNRSDGSSVYSAEKSTDFANEAPPTRLYLLKLIVLLNFLQGATMLIAFTLASRVDVDDNRREFTLYSPTSGELSTAFSLVLYGFIFIGSGMLLRYAVPLGFAYFISSLIISASLHSPSGIFASSIILQLIFLVLCTWNMHSMERQVRKELILLCTVARDRARGNDLINNMLPPSMVLRLQIMQQESAGNAAKLQQQAGDYAYEEVAVQDENGQVIMKRVPVVQPEMLQSSSPLHSLDSGALLHASTHFYDVYENVSILFCYISSFSQLVCYMEPQSLVKLLNDVFSAFDDSILTFDGMYKVEAIAETYMAVSGCPFVNTRHAQTVAEFALNMQEIIARNQDAYEATLDAQIYHIITASNTQQPPKFARQNSSSVMRANGNLPPQLNRGRSSLRLQNSLSTLGVDGKMTTVPAAPQRPSQLSIQIGIHSGPIAAGVIGTKTLSYHIFGDAVNTASRMCSTSSPDHIQCSSITSALLAEEFTLDSQGVKQIKGKGPMETFFIKSRAPPPGRQHRKGSMRMAKEHPGVNAAEKGHSSGRLQLEIPNSSAHPVPVSPRNLLSESPREEAARHTVDSFGSIMASEIHHHHLHSHHRTISAPSPMLAQDSPLRFLHQQQHHASSGSNLTGSSGMNLNAALELAVAPGAGSASPPIPGDGRASISGVATFASISPMPPSALTPMPSVLVLPPVVGSSGSPQPPSSASPVLSPQTSMRSPQLSRPPPPAAGSSTLQFVAEFPASTWTLRLDDPGLEEDFHAVFLKKTRKHLRIILPVLFIASLIYVIAGAITVPSDQLRYFLPAILTAQVLLITLGTILVLSDHQEAVNAAAATSPTQKSSSDATSPRRHSELLSSPPILRLTSFFHRHDQALIGAVVCGVMICCNMSALYVRSHGSGDFQSSGDGSLISNFETLTNFNCLSMMVIFFIMRLYYRTAWVVALVVWADLILVYAFSGSSSRSSGMSLCVVLVCTLLSAYAQYHREYTSRFDFLLERVLMHEKNNLFQLLQNMLPSPRHAHKLMIGEQVIELQESVTMLFSDIRGFTQMATNLAPQDLCTLLNSLYSSFDEHLDVRGVYKIDTIGDAFVVVGGLAIENSTVEHASAIADFALDMLGEIENVKAMWQLIPEANPLIQDVTMRIGVHSGGVIAATVGLIRPKYLLFGRNTLIANAMESQGVPGQIQLSQSTFDLLTPGHTHFMDPRGSIDLGPTLGSMNTYFLKGRFSDLLRAARGRGRMQEDAAAAAAEVEAHGQLAEEHDAEDLDERHATQMLSASESTQLLAAADDTDARPDHVTPRASFFTAASARPRPVRRVQTVPTASSDDLSLSFSSHTTRASRALAKQIEFVRGGGRGAEWNGAAAKLKGGKRSGAPSSRSSLMKPQEQSLDRQMSLTLTTGEGAQTPLVPGDASLPGSGAGHSLHSTPGGSRPVTPRSASLVSGVAPPGVQLPSATGRAPHRRSFTLQTLNTNSLQLPTAPRTGLITPPGTGLPPISPQAPSAALTGVHPLPIKRLSATAHPSAATPLATTPKTAVEAQPSLNRVRSRSYSSANVLGTSGREFTDEENSHRPGFPRTGEAESLSLPVLHALVDDTLAPQTAAGHHRRRSSLSILGGHSSNPLMTGSVAAAVLSASTPAAFSRGISLHHRRSTSVLQLSLGPGGRSLASSAHGSGQQSRIGSVISTGSSEDKPRSIRPRPSLQIDLPGAALPPAGAAAVTPGAVVRRQQSEKSLATASTASTTKPSVRRIRSVISPKLGAAQLLSPGSGTAGATSSVESSIAEEVSPLGLRGISRHPSINTAGGTARRGSHSRAASAMLSPSSHAASLASSARTSRQGSGTGAGLISVAALNANVAAGARPTPPGNANRALNRSGTLSYRITTGAPAANSQPQQDPREMLSPPGPRLLPLPPLSSFDDLHVFMPALRMQHERDLDGQLSAEQVHQAEQYQQAIWGQKLALLAARRAQQAASTSDTDSAPSPMRLDGSTKPVLLMLNDERINAPAVTSAVQPTFHHHSTQPWISPLSPVPDLSPFNHSLSPASPLTYIMDAMDASLAANGSKKKSTPELVTKQLGNASPSPEDEEEEQSDVLEDLRRDAHSMSPPLSSDTTPIQSPPLHNRHRSVSRSTSQLHDHLDVLHSITTPPQTSGTLARNASEEKKEDQSPSPHLASLPRSIAVDASIQRLASLPVPSVVPAAKPHHLDVIRHASLLVPGLSPSLSPASSFTTSTPSSGSAARHPIARDEVEHQLIHDNSLIPPAIAMHLHPSRSDGTERSRSRSGSAAGLPRFHSTTPSSRRPSVSQSARRRSISSKHATGHEWNFTLPILASSDTLPPLTPNGGVIMGTPSGGVLPPPRSTRNSRSNSLTALASPRPQIPGISRAASDEPTLEPPPAQFRGTIRTGSDEAISNPGSRRHSFSGGGSPFRAAAAVPPTVTRAATTSTVSTNASAGRSGAATVGSGSFSAAHGGSLLRDPSSQTNSNGGSGVPSVVNSVSTPTRKLHVPDDMKLPPLTPKQTPGPPSLHPSPLSAAAAAAAGFQGSPMSAASSVHASPLPQPRPPALLLSQFKAIARTRANEAHSPNLRPSTVRQNPVSPMIARLAGHPHLQHNQSYPLAGHHPRTPSYGGFEIRFRGANQLSGVNTFGVLQSPAQPVTAQARLQVNTHTSPSPQPMSASSSDASASPVPSAAAAAPTPAAMPAPPQRVGSFAKQAFGLLMGRSKKESDW